MGNRGVGCEGNRKKKPVQRRCLWITGVEDYRYPTFDFSICLGFYCFFGVFLIGHDVLTEDSEREGSGRRSVHANSSQAVFVEPSLVVALTGSPGVGKTTIATLAANAGWTVTTVTELAEAHGMISKIKKDLSWEPKFDLLNGLIDSYENDYLLANHEQIDFSSDEFLFD